MTDTVISPAVTPTKTAPSHTVTPYEALIKALVKANLFVINKEQFDNEDSFTDVLLMWLNIGEGMTVVEPDCPSPNLLFLLETDDDDVYCYAVNTTTSRFVVTTHNELGPRQIKKTAAAEPRTIPDHFVSKSSNKEVCVLVPTVQPISTTDRVFLLENWDFNPKALLQVMSLSKGLLRWLANANIMNDDREGASKLSVILNTCTSFPSKLVQNTIKSDMADNCTEVWTKIQAVTALPPVTPAVTEQQPAVPSPGSAVVVTTEKETITTTAAAATITSHMNSPSIIPEATSTNAAASIAATAAALATTSKVHFAAPAPCHAPWKGATTTAIATPTPVTVLAPWEGGTAAPATVTAAPAPALIVAPAAPTGAAQPNPLTLENC